MEQVTSLSTGYSRLDELTGGFQPGRLYIVAGRPGMGKTAFILNSIVRMPDRERVPLLFCPEEPLSGIGLKCKEISSGKSTGSRGVKIDDTPFILLEELCSGIETLVSRNDPPRVIFVDGLEAIGSGRDNAKSVLIRLKSMAMTHGISVVVTAQIGESADKRGGECRPRLADIAGSPATDYFADVIVALHRPEYYNLMMDEYGESTVGRCNVIVMKNRQGPTGEVQLAFDEARYRFSEGPQAI